VHASMDASGNRELRNKERQWGELGIKVALTSYELGRQHAARVLRGSVGC